MKYSLDAPRAILLGAGFFDTKRRLILTSKKEVQRKGRPRAKKGPPKMTQPPGRLGKVLIWFPLWQ